jgi:peptide/nickel transport system substrate-binding protein
MRAHRDVLRSTTLSLLAAALLLAVPFANHAGAQSSSLKPAAGGSIAIRDIFGSDCINPLNPDVGNAAQLGTDTLISIDDHGKYRPNLATKWSYSHAGRWITLTLRQGVRFVNGHPFNAKSLKANFDYLLKQPAGMAPLQRAQVVGPYMLRLIYSAPLRTAIDGLAALSPVDVPAQLALGDNACNSIVGTGPFKVQSTGPGLSTITFVRNRLHNWSSPWLHNQGEAYLSSITVKTVTDDTQAASDVLAGDLDISRVAPAQLPRLQNQSGIKLEKYADPSVIWLGFNHAHAPLNKEAVRRAIAEAIDRKGLIKAAYGGLGVVAPSIVSSSDPYFDAGAGKSLPAYNPTDAARILKANQVTGPFTLETYTIPVFADTAQFIQAELENVGLKVNLAVKAVSDAQADMGRGQIDMFIDIFAGNDLYSYFHSSQTPQKGAHNWNFLHDPKLDKLIVQGRETVQPSKAHPIVNALQRYFNAHGVGVPLFARELVVAIRNRVHGYRYVPGSNTYMWPAFQELYVK